MGRWRVGAETGVLGRWARQTKGPAMAFRLDEALGLGPAVRVRVGFFDEGTGSWGLKYSQKHGSTGMLTISKTDTGKWVEARANLTDFACCEPKNLMEGGGHLQLVDLEAENGAGAEPDTFGWLEVKRDDFYFPIAEGRIVEMQAETWEAIV